MSEISREEWSRIVRKALIVNGWTQVELARELGVSYCALWSWQKNGVMPRRLDIIYRTIELANEEGLEEGVRVNASSQYLQSTERIADELERIRRLLGTIAERTQLGREIASRLRLIEQELDRMGK